ncbi:MAG: head GIN domain-containing protein [Bacteroidia bacterium]
MNQRLPRILLFLGLLAFAQMGCNDLGVCLNGRGPITEQTLDLAAFRGIHLTQNANVYLAQGDSQQVVVKAQENVLEKLDFTVVNEILVIDLEGCFYSYDLDVYVTLDQPVSEIQVSGSGDVIGKDTLAAAADLVLNVSGSGEISLDVDATAIRSDISGSGAINIGGTATSHAIKLSSSGQIGAYDLVATDHTVNISGSGKSYIYLEGGSLDVKITGSGSVYYRGTPGSVSTTITGSGKLVDDN